MTYGATAICCNNKNMTQDAAKIEHIDIDLALQKTPE